MRAYTIKKGLMHTADESAGDKIIEKVFVKSKTHSYMSSVAYLLSVPLAFVSIYLAYTCFLIPIILFLWPAKIDQERLEEKIIEKNH